MLLSLICLYDVSKIVFNLFMQTIKSSCIKNINWIGMDKRLQNKLIRTRVCVFVFTMQAYFLN